jgi:hypothetical protein
MACFPPAQELGQTNAITLVQEMGGILSQAECDCNRFHEDFAEGATGIGKSATIAATMATHCPAGGFPNLRRPTDARPLPDHHQLVRLHPCNALLLAVWPADFEVGELLRAQAKMQTAVVYGEKRRLGQAFIARRGPVRRNPAGAATLTNVA